MTMYTRDTVLTFPQAEASEGCADPEEYDENFLVQYCGDGAYLIDKETGEKSWSPGSGGGFFISR